MGRPAYSRFRCSCGEECVMVPNEKSGTLAPITTTAYDNGNVVLVPRSVNAEDATYRIVPKQEREADPKPRLLNHWSNCPDAGNFRR